MNATEEAEIVDAEEVTLEELSNKLDADLEMQQEELEGLQKDFEKIGDPQAIGKLVEEVVWREFEDAFELAKKNSGAKKNEATDIESEEDTENNQEDAVAEETTIDIGSEETSNAEDSGMVGISVTTMLKKQLGKLLKKIILKLVDWFRSGKKGMSSLVDSIKDAVYEFFVGLKNTIKGAITSPIQTVFNYFYGKIGRLLLSVWDLLKESWKALKEAFIYVKDAIKNKTPLKIIMLELSKIVVAGLSIGGGVALSIAIETGLDSMGFGLVPGLGSLSNIISMFFGFTISGIAGALAIRKIDRFINKKLKQDNTDAQIAKGNEILATQALNIEVKKAQMEETKGKTAQNINDRHEQAAEFMRESVAKAMETLQETDDLHSEISKANERNKAKMNDILNDLDSI